MPESCLPTYFDTLHEYCLLHKTASEAKHVQHVISQGKLIVKDKKVITVNEKEILEFSRDQGKRLWEKMKTI